MKDYKTPSCRVSELVQEASFLTGASSDGYPVDPVDPFHVRAYDPFGGGEDE